MHRRTHRRPGGQRGQRSRRGRRGRGTAWALLGLAVLGPPAARAVDAPTRIEWRQALDAQAEDSPVALAAGPQGRIALGGARSVRVVGSDGEVRTRLRRGPVADLAWGSDGTLWVATGPDLYRVEADGTTGREALSQRGEEQRVVRLAVADGWVAAASDQGVRLRGADGVWRPIHGLPGAPASLVAFRRRAARLELWSVIRGALWIAAPDGRPTSPWRVATREALPLTDRDEESALDLAFDLPGADAVLVFPEFLALRDGRGMWRSLRPALPPGARAGRIAAAFGRLWLATDAGLLSARELHGPWRRAAPPLGSLPVLDLAGGATLWAATRRGLAAARPADSAGAAAFAGASPPESAAHHVRVVARLHRAALRQQGLRPESLRDLHRRVRLRGWWPELDVSLGYADFHDRRRDYDQAFVSGDTRHLYDRQKDRGRDYDVALSLSWDLGDAAFHPEELDALRESRSLIALRDDVLDEVTALYFEREQVLARLAASPDAAGRVALELRAAELAAGLDAWTGGAFSAPDSLSPAVPPGG